MRRLDAHRSWLLYCSGEGLATSLGWTLIAVYYVRDVHMSPLQLVLVGTALEVGYFLFEVPTGLLADTYSRRASIIVAQVVMGIATLGMALTHSFAVIAALAAFEGFGWTFKSGATDAWLADEVGLDNVGRSYQRGAQLGRFLSVPGIVVAVVLGSVDLRLPIIAGGAVWIASGVVLAFVMPEDGFRPAPRGALGRAAVLAQTGRDGARLIRARPILLMIVGITLFGGLWSEGVDRLWEAHFLRDVGVPKLLGLSSVVWFGVLSLGVLLLAIVAAQPLIRRLEAASAASMARALLVFDAIMLAGTLGFALAGRFAFAVAAYWTIMVSRSLAGPVSSAWLNVNIDDSRVRATVISITSLGDSVGEWGGGPALGVIGNAFGIRAALVTAGAALSPALALYARAIRHHGAEPELEELPQAVEAGA
jgi:DHA3 family tetracycline resistance protein-like MFS transporter